MPKYKAESFLTQYGRIVRPGDEIELSDKQAKNLGDKVSKVAAKKRTESKEEK